LRVVPRVERGECVNAGVIVVCRQKRFLQAAVALDRRRVRALEPAIEDVVLDELERQLQLIPLVAAGDSLAGPIAAMELGERWHWLSAPSSTMIQPSPVHTGLCLDPAIELDKLFHEMVTTTS
jgi:hypothetical protein